MAARSCNGPDPRAQGPSGNAENKFSSLQAARVIHARLWLSSDRQDIDALGCHFGLEEGGQRGRKRRETLRVRMVES